MASNIEKYLRKKGNELSFLTIKGDAKLRINGYNLPLEGLDVPLITEELAASIKENKNDDVIRVSSIIRGMIFTIGIDSSFKHLEEYKKFLYAANPDIENYIIYEAATYGVHNPLDQIIYLKALTMLNPLNEKGLLIYAITLLKYGELELKDNRKLYNIFRKEGKEKLEELLNRGSQDPYIYYHLAFIYRDESQYLKSKLMGERYLNLAVEEVLKDNVILLLNEIRDLVTYEEGYEAILTGNTEIGLPLLEELLGKYPKWWNLHFFIALGYRHNKDFHKAIDHFDEVLEINRNQLDTLVELGLCYYSLNNIDKAIDYFSLALEIGGDNPEILCNMAVAYMENGDYQNAREYIEKSLEINPNDELTNLCYKKLMETMAEA